MGELKYMFILVKSITLAEQYWPLDTVQEESSKLQSVIRMSKNKNKTNLPDVSQPFT